MPGPKCAELIDGFVPMATPVSKLHDVRLSGWLTFYLVTTPGCEALLNATWLMSEDGAPQPAFALLIRPIIAASRRTKGPMPPALLNWPSKSAIPPSERRRFQAPALRMERFARILDRRSRKAEDRLAPPMDDKFAEIFPDGNGPFRSEVFPGLFMAGSGGALGGFCGTRAVAPSQHEEFVGLLQRDKRSASPIADQFPPRKSDHAPYG